MSAFADGDVVCVPRIARFELGFAVPVSVAPCEASCGRPRSRQIGLILAIPYRIRENEGSFRGLFVLAAVQKEPKQAVRLDFGIALAL